MDGSAIVFEDSDLDEVVDEGLVVGEPEVQLKMPNDNPVDFEDQNEADDNVTIIYYSNGKTNRMNI